MLSYSCFKNSKQNRFWREEVMEAKIVLLKYENFKRIFLYVIDNQNL